MVNVKQMIVIAISFILYSHFQLTSAPEDHWEGSKKIIKMHYVHVAPPRDECNHYVPQTYSNKN